MCLPVMLAFLQIIGRPSVPPRLKVEFVVNYYIILYFYFSYCNAPTHMPHSSNTSRYHTTTATC
jgi:hypothetical protein